MITVARKVLPQRLRRAAKPWYNTALSIKYFKFLKSLNIEQSRMLVLATPGRSGTHYMKFLFANYLKLLKGESEGPIDTKTKDEMLPNVWQAAYLGKRDYKKSTSYLELIGLDELTATHEVYQSPFWKNSKVLHIYRNPLDFCVSTFFFAYQYRTRKTGIVADPVEVMDRHLDDYAVNYLSYRNVAQAGNSHLLRVAYEDMITYPIPTFKIILRWLGVEAVGELVDLAIQYSSRESIRAIENRDGPIDKVLDTPDAKFVQDGSIGQWKTYFQPQDLYLV